MIMAVLWPMLMAAFVVLALPVVVFLAPPVYAARCAVMANCNNSVVTGAFVLTLIYSWLVWQHVTSVPMLLLLLVGVPWVLGRVVAM